MRGKNYGEINGKNGTPKAKSSNPKRAHRGNGVTSPADWGSVDAEKLVRVIDAVTRDGSAIRFGYTRDGGAYAVGFYFDGQSETEYIPPGTDMDEWLQGVIDDYGK